jgi:hypothetical protein
MRIVCVTCLLELRCVKTGETSIEGAAFGPYKLWQSERYGCPQCGFEVLAGFAQERIAEHYEPSFNETVARLKPQVTFFGSLEERQRYAERGEGK